MFHHKAVGAGALRNPFKDLLAVHGEHDNWEALVFGPDHAGQGQAVALVQEEVDKHKVGHFFADRSQRLAGRLRLATDVETGIAVDEIPERPTHQLVVIHDEYLSLTPHP